MGKKRKKIWMAAPLCLLWTLWRERNRVVFENEVTSAQRIKASFLSNLWTWANLYSVDNMNSFLDFLTGLGSRYGSWVCFWAGRFSAAFACCCFCLSPPGSLLYPSTVLLGTSWFFFDLYKICFLLIKKKS